MKKLFVPERQKRIDADGSERGHAGGRQRNRQQYERCHCECQRIRRRDAKQLGP